MTDNTPPNNQEDAHAQIFSQMRELYHKGLYRQALTLGESHWGDWHAWPLCEHNIYAGRILSNLGLSRKGLAQMFRTWRKHRDHPMAQYYYLRSIAATRGPLRALKTFGEYTAPSAEDNPNLCADWIALKGSIFGQYRDWDTADRLMAKAHEIAPGRDWVKMEKAYLNEAQDQYQQALDRVEPLAHDKAYRPAIQFTAHLYVLMDRRADAIELLTPHSQNMECLSLSLQLFRMYKETNQVDNAAEVIDRIHSYISIEEQGLSEELSIAAHNLSYLKGDYESATNALGDVRSGYFKSVRENLQNCDESSKSVLLDVPFVRQHHMTCAPATLTAISKFWQRSNDHLNIVEEICYDGTSNHAERQWAIQEGWETREFKLTPESTYALIDKRIPFTLSTVEPGSAHLQAVVGYDQRKGVYLIRDPYFPNIQEMLIKEAGEYYESSGPRCLALVPKEEAHLFNDIPFEETQFYDLNYDLQTHLNAHDRDKAVEDLEKMRALDPQHRLTLYGERSFARYDSNNLKELDYVESLLERYPEDLNLQADKSYLLGSLGRYQDQLGFLEEKEEEGSIYILQLLAERLRKDQRQALRTEKLLRKILSRQPTNATALWSLASILWDQGKREQSYELYRFCTCLEDKREGYITSYFKAAQHLKKTRSALATLKNRISRLGSRSVYPYLSYYRALSAIDKNQESIKVLEVARKAHPENGELLDNLANAYLSNGYTEKAQAVISYAKPYMAETEWLYLNALLARRENNFTDEKHYYEAILEQQPLRYDVIRLLAILHGTYENEEAAVQFIESRLKLNPNDKQLLEFWLNWSEHQPQDQQEKKIRLFVKRFPNDLDALLYLARFLLRRRRLDEAYKVIGKALAIAPNDTQAQIAAGDITYYQQQMDKAKQHFRKAIAASVDVEGVFPRLLQCCNSIEEKREELAFILDQLMKQTSFGNGIMEYKNIATQLIPDAEVIAVLKKAVKIRPDLWHSWAALSETLHSMGKNDSALSVINTAIKRYPLITELLMDRARIYFTEQKLQACEADLRKVLEIYPHWITAITRLVDVLESEGKYDEAAAIIDKAIIYQPNESVLHGYQADILMQKGEQARAFEHIEKALKLDPMYSWAWERFRQMAEELGKPERPKALAIQLTQDKPSSALAWRLLAENEEDLEERLKYLETALGLSSRDMDINLEKCRTLFKLNRHSELYDFIHDEKWQGNSPSELIAFSAWVSAQFQRFEEADETMKQVTDKDPAYYDAWRLRAHWARNLGEYADAIRFAEKCVDLRPHNPDTLTLASEIYLEARDEGEKVDEAMIGEHLRKSVFSNPRDQHNGLTWLDFLIEKKDLSTLDEALETIIFDDNSVYYRVRFLQIALLKEEIDTALQLFRKILCDKEDNSWLYNTAYAALIEQGLQSDVKTILHQSVKDTQINSWAGALWLRYCQDHEKSGKAVLTYIQTLEANPVAWRGGMEYVLSPRVYGKFTSKIIERYKKQLQGDPRLWSLVTFYYSDQQQWSKVLKWCKDNWENPQNEAWAVYLYNYGLRLELKWSLAERVNEFARSLPEDDYYDRIVLWSLIDETLHQGKSLSQDQFYRIRYDELAASEQYAYCLLKAINLAQETGLPHAPDQFDEILNEAKMVGQEVLGSKMAQKLKLLTRKYIGRTIEGGFLEVLKWKFKLFNLM